MLFGSYAKNLLQNTSLVPAKTKRHFNSHHPTLVGKNISFFKARLHEMKDLQKLMYSITVSTKKLLKVSYLISKKIAIGCEAHTIAENLIKSCKLDAVKILHSESRYQKLEFLYQTVQ